MAQRQSPENLFRRLTKLFRSGPVIKRKIKTLDTTMAIPDRTKSSGVLLFQKSLSPTYASITGQAYNLSERLMRYQDFQEMEYTPEIAAALDIYADETVASDEKGRMLHIHSDNPKIQAILEDLFYNTLNFEFNGRSWVRNLVKYGDFFLYNDVSPDYGVQNAFPIPVNEIEREENFDRDDPFAVRYRWVSLANRTLENWEVTHFRLLGNDMFLPYGSSIIEPARRIWRQLILIEDAMLVYRVVRAPERRVFYLDVGNTPADEVPLAVEQLKNNLRTNQVIDRQTGRVDLRYNPFSVDEDYYVAVRGQNTATKIETLAGGQNAAAVEDVQYIQRKLFAALKIPKAYLGYDDMLSSKATLAQEDIRFSRTVSVIQKTIIAELNKLAMIHLFAHGFENEELLNFTLKLSNPSTVAQQQKLELIRARFEIAGSAPEGMVDKQYIRKEVLNFTEEHIDTIDDLRLKERKVDAKIEAAGEAPEGGGGGGGGGADLFGGGGGAGGGGEDLGLGGDAGGDLGGDTGGGEEPAAEPAGGEEELTAGEEPEDDELEEPGVQLLTSADDDIEDHVGLALEDGEVPVKPQTHLDKVLYNRSRKRTHGASKTHMPDFNAMVNAGNEDANDVYDKNFMRTIARDSMGMGEARQVGASLPHDVVSAISRMRRKFGDRPVRSGVLAEDARIEEDVGVLINDDDAEGGRAE